MVSCALVWFTVAQVSGILAASSDDSTAQSCDLTCFDSQKGWKELCTWKMCGSCPMCSEDQAARSLLDEAEDIYDIWPYPGHSWSWEAASGYGHYRNWGNDDLYREGLESYKNSTIYTDVSIQEKPEMQYFFRRQIQCQGIPKLFDQDEFGNFEPRYENCMSHTKEIDGVNKVKRWNAKCSWAICKHCVECLDPCPDQTGSTIMTKPCLCMRDDPKGVCAPGETGCSPEFEEPEKKYWKYGPNKLIQERICLIDDYCNNTLQDNHTGYCFRKAPPTPAPPTPEPTEAAFCCSQNEYETSPSENLCKRLGYVTPGTKSSTKTKRKSGKSSKRRGRRSGRRLESTSTDAALRMENELLEIKINALEKKLVAATAEDELKKCTALTDELLEETSKLKRDGYQTSKI